MLARDYTAEEETIATPGGRQIERRQVLIERGHTAPSEARQVFITRGNVAVLRTITADEQRRWEESRPRSCQSHHIYRAWEPALDASHSVTLRDAQGQLWGLMHTRCTGPHRELAAALMDALKIQQEAMNLIVATCQELRTAAGAQARGVSRNCGEVRLMATIDPSGRGLEF